MVVVAAGTGSRLAAQLPEIPPKALVPVAGVPAVVRAVRAVADAGLPACVVVHPPGQERAFADALAGEHVEVLVPGGATRTQSVRAGVTALATSHDLVLVHDAARPLAPAALFERVVIAVTQDGTLAAAPALAVADTLKRVVAAGGDPPASAGADARVVAAAGSGVDTTGDATGGRVDSTREAADHDVVLSTVDRTGLVGVQTPQAFRRDALEHVLRAAGEATDELALVENAVDRGELEGRVVVVAGSPWAHKLTDAADLGLLDVLSLRPSGPGAAAP